jgi:hypothetical protein
MCVFANATLAESRGQLFPVPRIRTGWKRALPIALRLLPIFAKGMSLENVRVCEVQMLFNFQIHVMAEALVLILIGLKLLQAI